MRLLQRMDNLELALCHVFNQFNRRAVVRCFFGAVSRLGDGVFWYVLMLLLPVLHGFGAVLVSAQMALVGLLSLPLYRWLKHTTGRARPCHRDRGLLRSTDPLDEFSFPSGHTMHAVGFSVVLVAWYPGWVWVAGGFTVLVAVSRLVLGLHYPSDVAIGALLGAGLAGLGLWAAGLVV